jgi:hypothetical protein
MVTAAVATRGVAWSMQEAVSESPSLRPWDGVVATQSLRQVHGLSAPPAGRAVNVALLEVRDLHLVTVTKSPLRGAALMGSAHARMTGSWMGRREGHCRSAPPG